MRSALWCKEGALLKRWHYCYDQDRQVEDHSLLSFIFWCSWEGCWSGVPSSAQIAWTVLYICDTRLGYIRGPVRDDSGCQVVSLEAKASSPRGSCGQRHSLPRQGHIVSALLYLWKQRSEHHFMSNHPAPLPTCSHSTQRSFVKGMQATTSQSHGHHLRSCL